MGILYRPTDGVAADFIPFYWQGNYHLFYLKDYRNVAQHGHGTPWWHLVTRDFVTFEDHGEALARGPQGAQDLWVFTGSVIERDGTFHIFYTGHNHQLTEQHHQPMQAVMHATSPDLDHWTKDPGGAFFAPAAEGYEPHDWRDPFVFWHPRAKEYWMLLAARRPQGPSRWRGLIALAASPDLKTWTVRQPFWEPELYYTHECPDLFRLGSWYYLICSEFSDTVRTRYRLSRSLAGPWQAPPDDLFDDRAFYAAKTAGDRRQRFIFGWLPTRQGEKDDGGWEWGGNLVVHELHQQPDGTLTTGMPATVAAAFTAEVPLIPRARVGQWQMTRGRFATDATSRGACLTLGPLPDEGLVELTAKFTRPTASFSVLLRADEALDHYYQVRLEPARQRLVIDRWPRPQYQPFTVERPLVLRPGRTVRLQLLLDGTCLVVYADGKVACCCRMYEFRTGELGLTVAEGQVTFSHVRIRQRP